MFTRSHACTKPIVLTKLYPRFKFDKGFHIPSIIFSMILQYMWCNKYFYYTDIFIILNIRINVNKLVNLASN